MTTDPEFDPQCVKCSRLAQFIDVTKAKYPDYFAAPVPPYGAVDPELLIVGLAPGLHGANATGRPFTGDHAGILLYKTLFNFGFSNKEVSTNNNDGLTLTNCRITNAVKCVPPQNKPIREEINTCNAYLRKEIADLKSHTVILALGKIAHDAVIKTQELRHSRYPFKHGGEYLLSEGKWLISSYHCSRYNTQTRRLTEIMFNAIFDQVRSRLDNTPGSYEINRNIEHTAS